MNQFVEDLPINQIRRRIMELNRKKFVPEDDAEIVETPLSAEREIDPRAKELAKSILDDLKIVRRGLVQFPSLVRFKDQPQTNSVAQMGTARSLTASPPPQSKPAATGPATLQSFFAPMPTPPSPVVPQKPTRRRTPSVANPSGSTPYFMDGQSVSIAVQLLIKIEESLSDIDEDIIELRRLGIIDDIPLVVQKQIVDVTKELEPAYRVFYNISRDDQGRFALTTYTSKGSSPQLVKQAETMSYNIEDYLNAIIPTLAKMWYSYKPVH